MMVLETILVLIAGYAAVYGAALTAWRDPATGSAPFGVAAAAIGLVVAYRMTE